MSTDRAQCHKCRTMIDLSRCWSYIWRCPFCRALNSIRPPASASGQEGTR
jgi:LSD1 subclass zinc finger protein